MKPKIVTSQRARQLNKQGILPDHVVDDLKRVRKHPAWKNAVMIEEDGQIGLMARKRQKGKTVLLRHFPVRPYEVRRGAEGEQGVDYMYLLKDGGNGGLRFEVSTPNSQGVRTIEPMTQAQETFFRKTHPIIDETLKTMGTDKQYRATSRARAAEREPEEPEPKKRTVTIFKKGAIPFRLKGHIEEHLPVGTVTWEGERAKVYRVYQRKKDHSERRDTLQIALKDGFVRLYPTKKGGRSGYNVYYDTFDSDGKKTSQNVKAGERLKKFLFKHVEASN